MWPLPATLKEFQESLFDYYCPICEDTRKVLSFMEVQCGGHARCLSKKNKEHPA